MKHHVHRKRFPFFLRGSAIVEAVISMLLICMILFGLLQFFYYAAAQMVTDYAAFRAARSESVGFKDALVTMEGRLKAISASGRMRKPLDLTYDEDEDGNEIKPNYSFSSVIDQFRFERLAIIDFMENKRPLEYEYWEPKEKDMNDDTKFQTRLTIKSSSMGNSFTEKTVFTDYPWIMPFRKAFVTDGKIDIKGESKMSRHSAQYLE